MAIGILICVGCASGAEAQQPASVVPPETVWNRRSHIVFTTTGEEVAGRLVTFGPDDVRLLVKGQVRAWRLDDVVRVDRKGDSLRNGAIIGALVLGGWCAFICGQGLDESSQLSSAVIVNAGLGALIGTAIDAGSQHRVTIYQKSMPASDRQARRVFLYRVSF